MSCYMFCKLVYSSCFAVCILDEFNLVNILSCSYICQVPDYMIYNNSFAELWILFNVAARSFALFISLKMPFLYLGKQNNGTPTICLPMQHC